MSLAPSDELLATQAARGDTRAFEALVRRHTASLCAFCARFVGEAEAEDRVQEAFLRAYENLHRYEPSYRFTSWLMKIAQNLCIDALRARRAWEPLPEEVPGGAEAPPLTGVLVDEVREAAEDLSPRARAVLHHKYVLGLNASEIGRELEMSPQNVRVVLHRAIQALRAKLS